MSEGGNSRKKRVDIKHIIIMPNKKMKNRRKQRNVMHKVMHNNMTYILDTNYIYNI